MSQPKQFKTPDQMKEEWDAEWNRHLAMLPPEKQQTIRDDPEDSAADALDEATERALAARYTAPGKDRGEA
jgi:hypothetical protein